MTLETDQFDCWNYSKTTLLHIFYHFMKKRSVYDCQNYLPHQSYSCSFSSTLVFLNSFFQLVFLSQRFFFGLCLLQQLVFLNLLSQEKMDSLLPFESGLISKGEAKILSWGKEISSELF